VRLLFPVLLLCALSAPAAPPARGFIMTWGGDTPEWFGRLGATRIRLGCGSSGEECLQRARKAAAGKALLGMAVNMNAPEGGWAALEASAPGYGRLLKQVPKVDELTLDDFVRLCEREGAARAAVGLPRVMDAVAGTAEGKAARIGITVYEDELERPALTGLSPALRERVSTVYLYLHYRRSADSYARHVGEAKALFPKAAVVAGAYAYDRMSYLPCDRKGGPFCTEEQELALFRAALAEQVRLMRQGDVAGIEFYPGAFGMEEKWHGWAKPRICRPGERDACVERTRKLRAAAVELLKLPP
jgi:hypothetical protein